MCPPAEAAAGSVRIEMHDAGPASPAGIALLRLSRPRKLNALNTGLEQELRLALRAPEVRAAGAIVLTGNDRAFSAGADLGELASMTPAAIAQYVRASGRVYGELADLPQPTVAAISGYCLGGGLELALACDTRIATDTARLGFPEIELGILPSSGGVTRAVAALGPAVARDLILFGEEISAQRAYEIGLLRAVVSPGTAEAAALEAARTLAAKPALALAWTKAAIDAAAQAPQAVSLLIEQLAYAALNRSAGATAEPADTGSVSP